MRKPLLSASVLATLLERGVALRTRPGRRLRHLTLTTFLLAFFAVSSTALAAPVWNVESEARPTAFQPSDGAGNDEYRIKVENLGSTSSGPITVVDRLPPGVSTTATPREEDEFPHSRWSCSAGAGQTVVTCTSYAAVERVTAPYNRAEPQSTLSAVVSILIPVTVAGGTPAETGTNSVTVSGGGALNSASSSNTNPINAGPDTTFGTSFPNFHVIGAAGEPFTQAGGHPYAVTTNFEFDQELEPGATDAALIEAGAQYRNVAASEEVKTLVAELPLGLIGDPQATPRCSQRQFAEPPQGDNISACPANTRAGVLFLEIPGVTGPYQLYNLVPGPGHAAQFGFHYASVPIVLYGDVVHSARGYVLRLATLVPQASVRAVSLTFFGNPAAAFATGEKETPFLTNPVDCAAGEEARTLQFHTDTWTAPGIGDPFNGDFSDPNWIPSSATLPPVEGCGALKFTPSLSLQPSSGSEGGTTQADAPSGYNLNLEVPQTGEAGVQTGTLLTCLLGTWSNTPTGYSYDWMTNGAPIAGATTATHTVTEADAGKVIQCGVTATNPTAGSAALSAPVTVPPAPETAPPTAGSPTITGGGFFGAKEGELLTCDPGVWTGSPTFTYQWYDRGVAISAATSASYTVQPADVPGAIQCQVLGVNAGGSVAAISAYEATSPGAVSVPAVSGEAPRISAEVVEPATPELKTARVTLPEGLSVSPSAANGLQACSDAQIALQSNEPGSCPLASQLGTVKVTTPLLESPLEGQVFLGEPECSPCSESDAGDGHLFRLFIQVHSQARGITLKLPGIVKANPQTGRLTAEFAENPQLPFSDVEVKFKDGPRAPLASPQTCGTFTTVSDLEPWSTPETPTEISQSPFAITGCDASMPFAPAFDAGTSSPAAGAYSPFSVTFSRSDGEQDLGSITVQTPPGLLGKIAGIPRCSEAEANAGTCGPESQIGTTTATAGPGSDPYAITGGRVYLTGPYKDQPFGLSIVVPAVAGPFNLGNVVVRASIAVNPATSALTITSDPLPQIRDGVPFRLRSVTVEVNRPGFIFNATNCSEQAISATITGEHAIGSSEAAKSSVLPSPYAASGCANLPFKPKLTAVTGGQASKADGASLDVKVESAGLGPANIAKVVLQLPKALPSRLSTIQKACTEPVFDANPAACDEGSVIGKATIHTPLLNNPLTGPAYFVSHGGAAFPDVEFVLQGEGVTLILDGKTDIKNGITYSRFESTPDAPFTTFETELPTGPHSILGAYVPAKENYSLCKASLAMPTTITGQNGAVIEQTTKIAVTGCKASKPLTRAQKLAEALKACKKDKKKSKRLACEKRARKKYGPKAKAKKSGKRSSHGRGSR